MSKHIDDNERDKIAIYHGQGLSIRKIARILKRHPSSISDEIKRNKSSDGNYYANSAHKKAVIRSSKQHRCNASKKDDKLWSYIHRCLVDGWSPEQICGRIKKDIDWSICPETIYRHIYSGQNKHLTLWVYLRRKQKIRKKKHGRRIRREIIKNRRFIDNRDTKINTRKEVGHWETDIMIGKRETKDYLNILTERKTRYVMIDKLITTKAINYSESLIKKLRILPHFFRQSITSDNGTENAGHQTTSAILNLKYYFCHPYHSWEKGTVENTIGLLREYLPKKTSFANITNRDLQLIAELLNNRPRKCLNYLTPKEAMIKEMQRVGFRS
jgi:IS30 family transposase